MKVWICLAAVVFLLSGCRAGEVYETAEDACGRLDKPAQKQISLEVSQQAQVLQGETGKLYLCDGYELTAETVPGGDIRKTMETLTGYPADSLTVMRTDPEGTVRYEWAWSAAGENGDVVGRAAVLDDGVYHYCITVMASAADAGKLQPQWQKILDSFCLVSS